MKYNIIQFPSLSNILTAGLYLLKIKDFYPEARTGLKGGEFLNENIMSSGAMPTRQLSKASAHFSRGELVPWRGRARTDGLVSQLHSSPFLHKSH